jgi:hypothetical protein
MAKLEKTAPGKNLPGADTAQKQRGRYIVVTQNGRTILRSWPRPRPRSPREIEQQEEFKKLAYAQNHAPADVQVAARNIAQNSKYTWRDILALAMTGKLIEIGNYGEVINQYNLDILGTTPGMVIIRTVIGWIALAPGDEGQVLTVEDGLPAWVSPEPPPASGWTAGMVRLGTAKTCPANTPTYIDTWTETGGYDPASMWTSSQPSRLTVPSGYAWARPVVGVSVNLATTLYWTTVWRNHTEQPYGSLAVRTSGASRVVTGAWIPATPGDYFELEVNPAAAMTVQLGQQSVFGLECRT